VYRCPADKLSSRSTGQTHVRSCSLNCYMEPMTGFISSVRRSITVTSHSTNTQTLGGKMAGPRKPLCFWMKSRSILPLLTGSNDGYFNIFPNSINDRPAVNHGGSTSFTFADGHAQFHKWSDTYLQPSGGNVSRQPTINGCHPRHRFELELAGACT